MPHENDNIASLNDAQLLKLREQLEQLALERGLLPLHSREQSRPDARRLSISDGLRRLNKQQLEKLAESFDQWVRQSRDSRTRRSRQRVQLVFLMLRYTGARLGEILALDAAKDIDFESCLVRFPQTGGEDLPADARNMKGVREVPLPEEVVQAIRECLSRNQGLDGTAEGLFRLDQGFVRRKFHEQEKRSGIPRELLNPRCLRNSRAAELVQGGMPLRAVQAMLGYASSDFISSHVTLAEKELKHIVQQYCRKEFGMETSARNTFQGDIVNVAANNVQCEVLLRTDSGYEIAAIITNQSREKLGLEVGRPAAALIKATWVILEKGDKAPETSARNAFPGVITSIVSDEIVADVQGRLGDGTPVCALVTTGSLRRLGIGEGDPFVFMFKAMSVIIS